MKLTNLALAASIIMSVSASARAQQLTQTILPPNLEYAAFYGSDLEVEGNTLVIADMGARSSTSSCGSINDGAVYVYVRSSAASPWPAQPTQTFLSGARESHFGEHVSLHGNTLLITESRASQGATSQVGAFHYYRRANATAPFQLIDTEYKPSNAQGPMFTLNGFASNGRYVAGVTMGSEPNIRIYKLTTTGITPVYDIAHTGAPLYSHDQLAITDNDVLVVTQHESPHVDLYKLADTTHTVLNSSALALADNASLSSHLYLGKVATHGRDVVVLAQGRSTAAPPDDLLTYYLKAFTVNGTSVQIYGDAGIPQELNEAAGYIEGRDTLGIAPGPTLLANIAGANGHTAYALAYEFDGANGFELAAEVDMVQFNPNAGEGVHQDFGQPIAYDGGKLYIGDPFDKTAQHQCRADLGSVRVFDVALDTNPRQLCIAAQDVQFSFSAVPGAVSYNWWVSGEAQVTSTQNTAIIDFGGSFTSGTVNMGVQLSSAPYYVTQTANVTTVPCDVADATVSGAWYQCSGAQGYIYTTDPVPNATSYQWWSDGTTSIVANGPTATVDFRQNFAQTTINVGINLSVAPYYTTRSITVNQMACGEQYPWD